MTVQRLRQTPRMSRAVIHGDTVYVGGQTGNPDSDIATQTRQVLEKIEDLLKEAGCSRADLLMVTVWLTDINDFAAMNAVWDEWFRGIDPPARATCEAKLAAPGYKIEMVSVAASAASR